MIGALVPLCYSGLVDFYTTSGNGITDFYHQVSSVFDMQCTAASVPPIMDIACVFLMNQSLPITTVMQYLCPDETNGDIHSFNRGALLILLRFLDVKSG